MALLRAATTKASIDALTNWTVPKSRKLKFELALRILDLNNVPLTSGTSYVKWWLPSSAAAEHRGRTSKVSIKDHKAGYDYEKSVQVRLTVDKSNNLQEAAVHFEVIQEYSGTGRGERITLGNIRLNLAEYVEPGNVEGEGEEITRRYLMQDSKINSTLRVGVLMRQLEGDRNYVAPPLRTAPVFGGIAGIIAGEQGDADEAGAVPSMSNKSREAGEAQDLYRQNLAAYWTAQPGELRADECIENIFSGGDGWGTAALQQSTPPSGWRNRGDSLDEDRARRSPAPKHRKGHHRHNSSRDSRKSFESSPRFGGYTRPHETNSISAGVGGRASLEQHANNMKAEAAATRYRQTTEVDEFELRDHLRSWTITEKAS